MPPDVPVDATIATAKQAGSTRQEPLDKSKSRRVILHDEKLVFG
jgi:hypothetical protein